MHCEGFGGLYSYEAEAACGAAMWTNIPLHLLTARLTDEFFRGHSQLARI